VYGDNVGLLEGGEVTLVRRLSRATISRGCASPPPQCHPARYASCDWIQHGGVWGIFARWRSMDISVGSK
jgi:hypothetical protein